MTSSLKLRLTSSLKLRLIKGGIQGETFILKRIRILLLPPLTPLTPLIKGGMQGETCVVGRAGEGFFQDSAQTAPTPQQP